MATFGYTLIGGASWAVLENRWCYASKHAPDHYTANAGDVVTKLWAYVEDSNRPGNTAKLAIYDVIGGVPTNKVGESATFAGLASGWHSIAVNIPLAAGVTYCVAFGEIVGGNWRLYYDAQANACSETNSGPFPDPWVDNATLGGRASMYAEYTAGGGPPPLAGAYHLLMMEIQGQKG